MTKAGSNANALVVGTVSTTLEAGLVAATTDESELGLLTAGPTTVSLLPGLAADSEDSTLRAGLRASSAREEPPVDDMRGARTAGFLVGTGCSIDSREAVAVAAFLLALPSASCGSSMLSVEALASGGSMSKSSFIV